MRELRLLLGAAMLVFAYAGRATAQPVWVGDFETGDKSQFGQLNGKYIFVVDDVVAEGDHAARIELHNDATWPNGLKRVELGHGPAAGRTGEGKTVCMAWSVYVPTTLSADPDQNFGYWETNNSYQNLMDFVVAGDTIRFFALRPTYKEYWVGTHRMTPATWHRLANCVLFSSNADTGRINVWFDGEHVVVDQKQQTRIDGNDVFMQFGLLRGAIEFADTPTVYIDDAAEGNTKEDVFYNRLPGVTPTPDSGAPMEDAGTNGQDSSTPVTPGSDAGPTADASNPPQNNPSGGGNGSGEVTGGCAVGGARGNNVPAVLWFGLLVAGLVARARRRRP